MVHIVGVFSGGVDTYNKNRYDLEERTAVFGQDVINFAKKIPKNNYHFNCQSASPFGNQHRFELL